MNCTAPWPIAAGQTIVRNCFTCGLSVGHLSFSVTPACLHDHISHKSCATPETVTAIACVRAVSMPVWPRKNTSPAIMQMLSSTGAAAFTQKRFNELRMPPSSDTSEISIR